MTQDLLVHSSGGVAASAWELLLERPGVDLLLVVLLGVMIDGVLSNNSRRGRVRRLAPTNIERTSASDRQTGLTVASAGRRSVAP